MTVSKEIERKILLKEVPKIAYDEVYYIKQYYIREDDKWIRYRRMVDSKGNKTYIRTYKEKVENGVSNEYEEEISKKKYLKKVLKSEQKKVISKHRYVKNMSDGMKWEIDDLEGVKLVIAEIEMPSLDYKIKIPKFIRNSYIKDVTRFREFSNRKLASYI